ncbi:MAG: polyprenyl synthetase family protein [Firmicutes bacterium]|nr:polyprenyl synthetase family protein [Bacillota bacterium]
MTALSATNPILSDPETVFPGSSSGLMQSVETSLLDHAGQAQSPLDEMIRHILEAGGKRLRPRLAIACAEFGVPSRFELVATATALEMIHMASLIHDDVIDESATRRGRRTINRLWGNQTAVLAGDYLFSSAFRMLCSHRLYDVLVLLTGAIGMMCEGEINQFASAYRPDYTREAYYDCIFRKTACLFAASCQAGAMVAGCSPAELERLYEFGLHLGYAYQILDDILDLVADPEKLGKPVGSDLSRGLLTLPTLLLLSDQRHGPWLRERLASREPVPDYLADLRERLSSSDALAKSLDTFEQHLQSARDAVSGLPGGERRETLSGTISRLSFEMAKHL